MIGVLLLTAVVLLTMAVVGAGLIGNTMASVSDDPLVDVDANATTEWVEVTHTGGDTVAADDVAIVLQADGSERHALTSFTLEEGADTTTFQSGDVWQRDHALDGDRMRVLAVHEPSNTVLDRETVPVTVTIAARFSYSPSSPTSTESVSFDASESSVAGSTITSYEWDLDDDGITDASGETISHTFGDDGSYPVTLTITADDGRMANRTRTVSVLNEAPSPSFTYSPSSPDTGEQIDFDATGSSDSDGNIQSYDWDFGDGTTASGQTVKHSYSAYDQYTVELTVTDDDGTSRSTIQTISVSQAIFEVAIVGTNSPVTEGETLSVDIEVSNTGSTSGTQDIELTIDGAQTDVAQDVTLDAGASRTLTLEWQTGNGDAGDHTATVNSQDDTDSRTVTVQQPMADRVSYVSGSGTTVGQGGNSRIAFDLQNSGSTGVTISHITVESVSNDDGNFYINNPDGKTFDGAGGQYAGRIDIGTQYALDDQASIPGQSTETFELGEFRSEAKNGNSQNMKDETVDIKMTFTDGSQGQYTIEISQN